MVDFCNSSRINSNKSADGDRNKAEIMNTYLPRKDLFALIEQHKMHLKFVKENDICSEEEKIEIVARLKRLFEIMNGRY